MKGGGGEGVCMLCVCPMWWFWPSFMPIEAVSDTSQPVDLTDWPSYVATLQWSSAPCTVTWGAHHSYIRWITNISLSQYKAIHCGLRLCQFSTRVIHKGVCSDAFNIPGRELHCVASGSLSTQKVCSRFAKENTDQGCSWIIILLLW